jgi:hypothetical protein
MMQEQYYVFFKMLTSYKPNLKSILVDAYNPLDPASDKRIPYDSGDSKTRNESADINKIFFIKM